VANRKGNGRQRQLGRRLRRMREDTGLTIDAAAEKLEFSASKLGRIETAEQGVDVHVVRSMLDLYDVGGDRWTETLQLVRDAREKPWYANYLKVGDYGYVAYEADADHVQDWAPNYVPGLLQTADYARALFAAFDQAPERTSEAVEIRQWRQRRLSDEHDRVDLVAITTEAVLRNAFGDPPMMRAQLAHLMTAAELPTVTLQVLPSGTPAHASLASGFIVLSFGALGEPDLAYVEHALGAAFLEGEDDVRLARNQFDRLRTLALAPAASLALLREIAAAL
jgi:transcriptional regulator with XRE-family HTH domain